MRKNEKTWEKMVGKVKTPKCIKCEKIEFHNRVYLGRDYEEKTNYCSEVVCKECEAKLTKINETHGRAIYQR